MVNLILFNQKSQSKKLKVKQMKPSVLASKTKSIIMRDHLRSRKMNPKVKLNNTRKKEEKTPKLQYENVVNLNIQNVQP